MTSESNGPAPLSYASCGFTFIELLLPSIARTKNGGSVATFNVGVGAAYLLSGSTGSNHDTIPVETHED
jgi:hypothetical protein